MNRFEGQVRLFYSEIWNKKNTEIIPEVLHEDLKFRGSLGTAKHGHSGFIEYLNEVHGALSNYKCTIVELVVQADKVFAKMLFNGIHDSVFLGYEPSNKSVSWEAAALFGFNNDKIENIWVLGDLHGLCNKLGTST